MTSVAQKLKLRKVRRHRVVACLPKHTDSKEDNQHLRAVVRQPSENNTDEDTQPGADAAEADWTTVPLPRRRNGAGRRSVQLHHVCQLCTEKFASWTELNIHRRDIHQLSSVKRYQCEVCRELFVQSGALKTHVKSVHRQEKPFACSECNRSFGRRSILNKHLLTHKTEMPYKCDSPECGKSFRLKQHLKRHYEFKHSPIETRRFGCTVCGRRFVQKGDLDLHYGRTHSRMAVTTKRGRRTCTPGTTPGLDDILNAVATGSCSVAPTYRQLFPRSLKQKEELNGTEAASIENNNTTYTDLTANAFTVSQVEADDQYYSPGTAFIFEAEAPEDTELDEEPNEVYEPNGYDTGFDQTEMSDVDSFHRSQFETMRPLDISTDIEEVHMQMSSSSSAAPNYVSPTPQTLESHRAPIVPAPYIATNFARSQNCALPQKKRIAAQYGQPQRNNVDVEICGAISLSDKRQEASVHTDLEFASTSPTNASANANLTARQAEQATATVTLTPEQPDPSIVVETAVDEMEPMDAMEDDVEVMMDMEQLSPPTLAPEQPLVIDEENTVEVDYAVEQIVEVSMPIVAQNDSPKNTENTELSIESVVSVRPASSQHSGMPRIDEICLAIKQKYDREALIASLPRNQQLLHQSELSVWNLSDFLLEHQEKSIELSANLAPKNVRETAKWTLDDAANLIDALRNLALAGHSDKLSTFLAQCTTDANITRLLRSALKPTRPSESEAGVTLLMQCAARPACPQPSSNTPLCDGRFCRVIDMLVYLHDDSPSSRHDYLQAKTKRSGTTALHLAAMNGCVCRIQTLLYLGSHVNTPDRHGRTALICAIERSHHNAVLCLIEAGADFTTPIPSRALRGTCSDLLNMKELKQRITPLSIAQQISGVLLDDLDEKPSAVAIVEDVHRLCIETEKSIRQCLLTRLRVPDDVKTAQAQPVFARRILRHREIIATGGVSEFRFATPKGMTVNVSTRKGAYLIITISTPSTVDGRLTINNGLHTVSPCPVARVELNGIVQEPHDTYPPCRCFVPLEHLQPPGQRNTLVLRLYDYSRTTQLIEANKLVLHVHAYSVNMSKRQLSIEWRG